MSEPSIRVQPAVGTARDRALELLFGHLDESERPGAIASLLESVADGDLTLDGLLVASRDETAVGAVLFAARPDRTAFLWPPAVASVPEADAVADELLAAAVAEADAADVRLTQILLEHEGEVSRELLAGHGFERLARLVYLQRWLHSPLPPRDETDLAWECYRSQNHARFVRAVERSYEGTRDCPGLSDCRTAEEALEGHRLSGVFDPARWWLARLDDADVGVLLMAEHAREHGWELVYVGVDPAFRGRGLGRKLTLHGLHAARAAGREWVLLAADAANDVALAIYDDLGFEEVAQREVFIRVGAA